MYIQYKIFNVAKRKVSIKNISKIQTSRHFRLSLFNNECGEFVINNNFYKIDRLKLYFLKPKDVFQVVPYKDSTLDITNILFNFSDSIYASKDTQNLYKIPSVISNIDLDYTAYLFSSIYSEFSHNMLYYNERINLMLADLFYIILRQINISTDNYLPISKNLDDIFNFIYNNADKQISNEYIGQVFHFHPNYINSLIKKATGMSLHQYLINLKINRAIELLHDTNMSIGDIAKLVGFNDIAYFSRYFKKREGYSPSLYRTKTI